MSPSGSRRSARPRWRACPSWSASGLSTLESLIVVSVLGVVVGMSVIGMRGALARERVDGWVRTMAYDIAAARQAALTRRTTVTVSVTSHAYTIGAADGGTLRQAVLPEDIVLSTTCPAAACSFNRRGVPLAAGTIAVTNTTTGRTYTVRITAGTGRVSYSEP